ncbi:MAG: sigma-54 dependent transcriptional regulator [Acidobacteriota bacterium]
MNEDRPLHLSTETHIDSGWQPERLPQPPGFTLLWHPDPSRVGERVSLPRLESGRAVELSRLEPELIAPGGDVPRPLEDPHLSRPAINLRIDGDQLSLDPTGTSARVVVDGRVVTSPVTLPVDALKRGVVVMLADRIVLLLHRLDPLAEPELDRFGLVGDNSAIRRLCHDIARVADLDVPVLIRGENGTGKELVAGALHHASGRHDGPYLTVNLAGVPGTLAASELFGSAKGAFTGADRARRGYFERATGGTLFLDEIGDTPPDVQVLLLRVLESGQIQPLGAEEPRPSDVRLIAATDRDLEAAVADGSFRQPLIHRLAGFVLDIPPLRERRDDLGRLIVHFLRHELEAIGESDRLDPTPQGRSPWMPAPLIARLALHPWPGNVRQLRNVVRELVIGSRGSDRVHIRPTVERLLDEARPVEHTKDAPPSGETPTDRRPDQISETELRDALRATQWRPFAAARRLGISRGSIYDLIAKHPSIRNAKDLNADEIAACQSEVGDSVEALANALEVSALGLRRRMKELGIEIRLGSTRRDDLMSTIRRRS